MELRDEEVRDRFIHVRDGDPWKTGLMGEATAATPFLGLSPWPITWVCKNKLLIAGVQGDDSSGGETV
jgi:hypothetical protein